MLKRFSYLTALFGVIALFPNSALPCAFSPPPVYKNPEYIKLNLRTDNPTDDSYGYYDADANYLMLIEEYIPALKNAKANDTNQWMSYEDGANTKDSYDKAVSALLKTKGLEWQKLPLTQSDRYNYYSYWDRPGMCHDDNNKAALDFLNEAFSDSAVRGGYLELAQIREEVTNLCVNNTGSDAVFQNINILKQKNIAGDYPAYLEAAVYFYSQAYDKALPIFEALAKKDVTQPNRIIRFYHRLIGKKEPSKWLKETSTYMIARVHLVKSQYKWDGYSHTEDMVDKTEVNLAKQGFDSYLKAYPNGLYVNSAKGLQRKIDNLAGDTKALGLALKNGMTEALNLPDSSDKANIIYNRYLEFSRYAPNIDIAKDHPLLVAYEIMNDQNLPSDALVELDSSKKHYETYPGLYKFLKAAILFRNKQYAQLLEQIPAENLVDKPIPISIEALRARSYEALGNEKEAIATWQKINLVHKDDDTTQLALAGLYVNKHHFRELLLDKTISNKRIFLDMLQFATTNQELVELLNTKLPQEKRNLVERQLLKRYILTGDFKEFSSLIANSATPGIFKEVQESAETLSDNPNDPASLSAIGSFIHNYNITAQGMAGKEEPDYDSGLDEIEPYCKSCINYNESSLVKHMLSAYDYFVKAEDNYKISGKNENEAKTLHYLVECFRPSTWGYECVQRKDYKNMSKSYFNRLHNLYPNSNWAKATKYYY